MTRPPFNPNLVKVPPQERLRAAEKTVSVSQLTIMVKRAIESSLPKTVHVVGEISNFKRHSSGHLYLTLKDSSSELSCVMWRSVAAKLKFEPADGLEVIATGNVEVFERAGRYQLYIRKLEPRGVGSLELAFRQLCEKLQKEGLFDPASKKPLPAYPSRIVMVTSPTGAAIADMIRTIERRYPCVEILVYPVRVQGKGAANEIARAVRRVNAQASALGGVDLMIVGRGGGSLEDLWAFNEEVVARAIFASRIPVISAVGHEVDVTVADLVADVRAATPTAAAEIAVPVLDDVQAELSAYQGRLSRSVSHKAELAASKLGAILHRPWFIEPAIVVLRREELVDELSRRIQRTLIDRLRSLRARLDQLEPFLERIAPHAFLLGRSVQLRDSEHRLRSAAMSLLLYEERRIVERSQRLERVSPAHRLDHLVERVDRQRQSVCRSLDHGVASLKQRIGAGEELLLALSYKSIMNRGFSITRIKKGKAVVRSPNQVRDGTRVLTETADGNFESQVINLNQLELFE